MVYFVLFCSVNSFGLDARAEELFAADQADSRGESWTYLPYGPFGGFGSYRRWVDEAAGTPDPFFYAIIDTDAGSLTHERAGGLASYLRIEPNDGSIEVGHVHYSPALQRRRGATEAQYLLMRHAFDELGYRRYEWMCDALNAASRAAATRLGFRYEGTFRQVRVVRGRNRDTAWYSIIDSEWALVRTAFEAWLDPGNFDDHHRQQTVLRAPNRAG